MSEKSHATGMAGEFFVMEKLFRLGYEASLTLGHAKSIDILVRSKEKNHFSISVKAVRSGGKWGIDQLEEKETENMYYVLLKYDAFETIDSLPEVYVLPANIAQDMKEPWQKEKLWAIFYQGKKAKPELNQYKEKPWGWLPK